MAIVKEVFGITSGGNTLYRTYSDAGKFILQNETGIEYAEAVDIEGVQYTYYETENPIEREAE